MSVQRTTATGGMETSFGFRQVGEGDKQPLVDEVFHFEEVVKVCLFLLVATNSAAC